MRKIFLVLVCLSQFACNADLASNPNSNSNIQVYINDGSKQCVGGGLRVKQTAEKLSKDGVKVISSSCGLINGMMVIAQCGASTLNINVHTIAESDLNKALQLGFKPLADLKDGMITTDCPAQKPIKGAEASF
ncbi:hypothetical protein D5018_18455 [Parashewanella curva]|uniref:Uncharacterized protein n=1 Tax=Parashewanella curva TaxID=2338552 RepID=A0A3L8PS56_9GAMM|nr:hypothetical protein [Parashewanella curva]RLV58231.1 hypothetical protein D5018_18455 [Parashewanella curva]